MAAVLVAATVISPLFRVDTAHAEQITNRSLELMAGAGDANSDGVVDGGSMPGGQVNHRFTFTVPNVGNDNVGSIKFEYCTIASVETCVVPENLSTAGASLALAEGDADGAGAGAAADMGFTLAASTPNGAPYLTRTAAAVTPGTVVTVQLNDVINPNVTGQPNYTFFVRISTYPTADATGLPTDTGSVAASTSTQIQLEGVMPESLIFCTGGTISVNGGGIPDCSTATAGNIAFDQLFSPTDTSTATSQMAASTNATTGYSISVSGSTLTSGANTINAMTVAGASTPGVSQFGMNLVANTTPTVGAAIAPASDGANDLQAKPTANYATADSFMYDPTGDVVARSDFSGSPGPTNSQIYTASYIVNVSGSQPAGTYATTLTYVCTATF